MLLFFTSELKNKEHLKMSTGYITQDESMIRVFLEDQDFAEYFLNEVEKDGDEYELLTVQRWYDEAKTRSMLKVAEG